MAQEDLNNEPMTFLLEATRSVSNDTAKTSLADPEKKNTGIGVGPVVRKDFIHFLQ